MPNFSKGKMESLKQPASANAKLMRGSEKLCHKTPGVSKNWILGLAISIH